MSQIMDKLDKLNNEVTNLKSRMAEQIADEDVISREAIFDILVCNPKYEITRADIQNAIDRYANFTQAIIFLLIDKKVCTRKDFHCHIMAAHHMIRKYGAGQHISNDAWFAERIAYARELAALDDPLDVV